VRSHLELLAVDLACQRRTDDDLHRLDDILARTDRMLADEGNIAALDTEFHVGLVEATHNSVLVRVLNAFYQFTARRRDVLFADLAQGRASGRDHRLLVEHLRQRDSVQAQQLILSHMGRARDYWTTKLPAPLPNP
jgi:GntR family transcriptional repressor for pyruvate dehydrogenase complex